MKRGEGRASTIKLLVLGGHSIGPAIYRSSETISLRVFPVIHIPLQHGNLLTYYRIAVTLTESAATREVQNCMWTSRGHRVCMLAHSTEGFNAFASSANSRTHLASAFALPLKHRGACKRSFDRQSFRVRLPKRFGLLKRRRRPLLGGQLLDGPDRIPCTPKVILLRRLHTC